MDTIELLRVLDAIKAIADRLTLVETKLQPPKDAYESAETKNLATALAKAQGEYPVIAFNRENPYFKSGYTDLDTILRAVRPILSKHGLSFTQQTKITEDGATMLHSTLRHASGEWIESRNRIIPPRNDAQTYGSTLSYQKRYAAMALLGVTCASDTTDDDAEIAMMESRQIIAKGTALNTKYNPKEESYEPITKEQLEEMEYELAEYPDIAEQILDGLKIQSLADLPKSKYSASMKRIREIKHIRNGTKL